MKTVTSIMAISLIVMSGCTADNNGEQMMDYEQQPLSTAPTTDSLNDMNYETNEKVDKARKALPFQQFDLEIDYVDTLSYQIKYVSNEAQTRAVINEIGEEKISGEKALDQLTPHFMELSFDEDSSEQEVIEDVLQVFGLDETYKEFKLRVVYSNGLEAEYED
ncbi:YusW family protein [Halobacillus sp. Nhm2S1]|uniref:YusW family protein n=1 Tax=Halobacillus sp. Nhm2S1 TaxID=2866716 RepID=UPI001C736283|nr:YusW family protein [Halobacillus sp. Nhm2S1]MBX0356314.1 YusW family protein [Halobacillus sp. Nhm2S1]